MTRFAVWFYQLSARDLAPCAKMFVPLPEHVQTVEQATHYLTTGHGEGTLQSYLDNAFFMGSPEECVLFEISAVHKVPIGSIMDDYYLAKDKAEFDPCI